MGKRWWQFSLRSMLWACMLSAVVVMIWLQRPSPEIVVEVRGDGTVMIGGQQIESDDLNKTLAWEVDYRSTWGMESNVLIRAAGDAKLKHVENVKQEAFEVGAEGIKLIVTDLPSVPNPESI